jgi:hypothetical protein
VLGGGQRHERIIDRTARYPQPAEHVRKAPAHFGTEQQRRREALAEQADGVCRGYS